jgi:adenosylhomocysteine nucleosidase
MASNSFIASPTKLPSGRGFSTRLVVMALEVESAGLFEAAAVPVLHCGVGKVNAAITLTAELARYAAAGITLPLVINFGSAGSSCHGTGAVVGCHEFVQRDMDARGLGFKLGVTPFDALPATLSFDPLFPLLPTARCGSGDSFVTTPTKMECQVVEMEAYALAKVCRMYGARFGCAKYVTDGADHQAADDWNSNVHKAAEAFLQLFLALP